MESFAITDIGSRREVNQDYVYCNDDAVGLLPNLYIVADGMGGHKAGDFASRYSVNEFEKELSDWGAVIIKFWVQIDKDTQLQRFTDRQNNPEKRWKITDEDWRNREKWDLYEEAVDEMLQKTSTTYAPWHILESVDKKYARIKALKIIIEELEKVLD